MTTDLSSKRVLLLGAETDLGRAVAAALADAGARLALVGATSDAETAFAVQRLARKLGAEVSQAIDATNEMAVRVMVRQVSKALGGLDAVLFCAALGDGHLVGAGLIQRHGTKELVRSGGGTIVLAVHDWNRAEDLQLLSVYEAPGVRGVIVRWAGEEQPIEVAVEMFHAIAHAES